ncbi:hypothetical protein Droror1_Dr00022051 [Drosera rotundifolia]
MSHLCVKTQSAAKEENRREQQASRTHTIILHKGKSNEDLGVKTETRPAEKEDLCSQQKTEKCFDYKSRKAAQQSKGETRRNFLAGENKLKNHPSFKHQSIKQNNPSISALIHQPPYHLLTNTSTTAATTRIPKKKHQTLSPPHVLPDRPIPPTSDAETVLSITLANPDDTFPVKENTKVPAVYEADPVVSFDAEFEDNKEEDGVVVRVRCLVRIYA